jgi:hypothetical protein
MLWNGNDFGKTKVNDNFKATTLIADYDLSKTTGRCGLFPIFGEHTVK